MAAGGRRPGAGRPKRNAERLNFAFSKEEGAVIDAYAELFELGGRTEALRRAIRVHMRRAVERGRRG